MTEFEDSCLYEPDSPTEDCVSDLDGLTQDVVQNSIDLPKETLDTSETEQLPTEILQHRMKLLNGLGEAVSSAQHWTSQVLSTLNWTKEHLLQKDEELTTCPFDSEHKMPSHALERHIHYCPLVKKGYNKQELDEEDESAMFWYENSTTVVPIKIDENLFKDIIRDHQMKSGGPVVEKDMPRTKHREETDLTLGERLAIYRYCVQKAQETKRSKITDEELMLLHDKKGETVGQRQKTRLEIMAEERNQRRRRQSYRAKNVHITKKSHTEIIRDVISGQMEILGQIWEDEEREKRKNERRKERDEEDQKRRERRDETQTEDRGHRGDRRRRSDERRYKDSPQRSKDTTRSRKRSRSRSRSMDRSSARSKSIDRSRRSKGRDSDSDRKRKRDDSPRHHKHKKSKKHKKHKNKNRDPDADKEKSVETDHKDIMI